MAVDGLTLQIYWEDLTVYVHKVILPNLGKADRFTLGKDIRDVLWHIGSCVIEYIQYELSRNKLLTRIHVETIKLLKMISVGVRTGAIPDKRLQPVTTLVTKITDLIEKLRFRIRKFSHN